MRLIRTFWIAVGVMVIVGCSSDAANDDVVPAEPIRILALGDSYTVVENVDKLESWPVQLVRELRKSGRGAAEPTVIAATGWDTNDLMRSLQLVDLVGPFDIVTLQIGVNNQFRGGTVSDFKSDLAALTRIAIDLSGGESRHVVLLSIPDWGVTSFAEGAPKEEIADEIDEFNAVINEQADVSDTRFVDVTGISRRAEFERELIAVDGLHPSAPMYSEWVELLLPEVREILD